MKDQLQEKKYYASNLATQTTNFKPKRNFPALGRRAPSLLGIVRSSCYRQLFNAASQHCETNALLVQCPRI